MIFGDFCYEMKVAVYVRKIRNNLINPVEKDFRENEYKINKWAEKSENALILQWFISDAEGNCNSSLQSNVKWNFEKERNCCKCIGNGNKIDDHGVLFNKHVLHRVL